MGGSITPKSENFIKTLYRKKLLDYIETRNIEIKLSEKNIINLNKIIPVAFDFEMEWLRIRMKNVKKIDPYLYNDFKKRLLEINKRIA